MFAPVQHHHGRISMEDRSIDLAPEAPRETSRRRMFGRLASASAAFGLAALMPAQSVVQAAVPDPDGPLWPGTLTGRHRQVIDAYDLNDGHPLAFAWTFLAPNSSSGAATAVVVLRHTALPIALNSAVWEKYQIGAALKITDPETGAYAVKNPFLHPKAGVLPIDNMAIDRLLDNGTIIGACNVALMVLSKKLGGKLGIGADEAAQEWAANMVPGVSILPSGTWGVNRAQEAGCTYCSGGG
jgi:hypothetical protein